MTGERVFPVLVSIAVIVLVAVVQERSRFLAAVLATMPLTAPLALWIVFSATKGSHQQTADFALSMVGGFIGALGACFGGNATAIAAAANVAATGVLERTDNRISFLRFAAVGVPVTVLSLAIATGYLLAFQL